MRAPSVHKRENERLEALEKSNLIYSPIEASFEHITRLTQKIFDVPIVAISLIDKEKQYFKSSVGLDIPEIPREISFCAHTILENKIMVVQDAQVDTRFADNPVVVGEPYIRFYAGQPIYASDENLPIGALCILDKKPRSISCRERSILEELASMVDVEISNRHSMETYKKLVMQLESSKRRLLIDGLTRLWNREGIMELLQQQIELSHDNKSPFAVLGISIDGFNSFVDEYGKNSGNDVLKNLAKFLLDACNIEDSVSFWGEKEFLIIIPAEHKTEILTKVRQIKNKLAHHSVSTQAGKIKMTVTMGLVFYNPKSHKDVNTLVKDVQSAVKQGRKQGGNQIIVH